MTIALSVLLLIFFNKTWLELDCPKLARFVFETKILTFIKEYPVDLLWLVAKLLHQLADPAASERFERVRKCTANNSIISKRSEVDRRLHFDWLLG